MTDFTHDIECLQNVWTCIARNKKTGRWFKFEISKRCNDYDDFCEWINKLALGQHRMVGFNNLNYDYPMIHHMVMHLGHLSHSHKKLTKAMYHKSQEIFENGKRQDTKFNHVLWPQDHLVEQLDLFKIHHFDNKARMTSLKRLQFNMRLKNIVEFHLDFDKKLKVSHIDDLMDYNESDVTSTEAFGDMSEGQIKFREDMTAEYGKNFMNSNDTKIGEDFLVMQLKEKVGEHILKDEDGKKRKTPRDMVPIEEFIFDYVEFDHPEFNRVLKQLQSYYMFVIGSKFHWNQNTDYTTGVLDLKQSKADLAAVRKEFKAKYCEQSDVDKVLKRHEKMLAEYSDHKVIADVDGFEFVFGKGGLHGTLRNTVMETTKDMVIVDLDVTSFYPKLGIENGLYPEHLTKAFCKVYESIFQMRVAHSKSEYPAINAMLKLALNGAYGKTNSSYSVLYDPLYTMSITVNGQLLLCMLWDQLLKIPGVSIIQANTDGITIYMPRNAKTRKKVSKVCKKWQNKTKLNLEQVIYNRMWIRDGNNYIAEHMDGYLKSKGDYQYKSLFYEHGCQTGNIEWHKNHSMLIVQKAVEAELAHGIPARKFITEHEDIYDFFLNTNVTGKSYLMHGDGVEPPVKVKGNVVTPARLKRHNYPEQGVSRYVVTNSGGYLTKVMPPLAGKDQDRYIAVNKGYKVEIYNTVESEDVSDYDINYNFYVAEAEKLLKPFRSNQ